MNEQYDSWKIVMGNLSTGISIADTCLRGSATRDQMEPSVVERLRDKALRALFLRIKKATRPYRYRS